MGKTQKIIDLQNEVDNLKGQLEEKEQECKTLDGRLNGIKKIVFGEAGGDAKIARLQDFYRADKEIFYLDIERAKKTHDMSGVYVGNRIYVGMDNATFISFLVADKWEKDGEVFFTFIAEYAFRENWHSIQTWAELIHKNLLPDARVFIPGENQITGENQFLLFQNRSDLIDYECGYLTSDKENGQEGDKDSRWCYNKHKELDYKGKNERRLRPCFTI